jgi:hypothetical protein
MKSWDDLPEGYFTKPVLLWFGQHWKPQSTFGKDTAAIRAAAVRGRDTMLSKGQTGTILGLSKKSAAIVETYRATREATKTKHAAQVKARVDRAGR